ncbi:MAG: FAD-binding oxidoreductase [Betaproteobacteria bacterium]|jgi:FAD-dependent oxidoreductase domain-containing protein 1|nr:FAD-binding oxidoreductase [Betaproteobacteria bacterium]NBO95882.1 FAD-binding oxidoreductase [Betaproteobacteria bacterium]NBP36339.1 FAD-binding oxidoreductase [Betaproteobacteria bacterium]NBP39592.1 FAD-binding oxidoreductase [Betaproteobacteria bacterium]NBQ79533.1 FAD-binding oxidoreductase [Betaproteobacteria bacterium]
MRSSAHCDRAAGTAYDVVIIGAGVMGASTAYWLKRIDSSLRIALIERDFSFSRASSSLSASSIRQQFSCPVNIALSQFGIAFLREASTHLSIEGEPVELGLTEPGYLYLANEAQSQALRETHAIQTRHGASVSLLDRGELKASYPWLYLDDIALGSLGLQGEGWFDGPALHQAFLRKALSLGVIKLQADVRTLHGEPGQSAGRRRLRSLVLDDGSEIRSDNYVCAAGAWSGALVRDLAIPLPIHPAARTVFVLSCPTELSDCPLLIDSSGFWLRPEGRFLIAGMPPRDEQHEPDLQADQLAGSRRTDPPLDPDYGALNEDQWARLAHRIPALSAMRIERAWAGYYEMNRFDHNAVIGPIEGFSNFYCLAGFSGHGMQHAPGAGLALSEWMLSGAPKTVDVRALGHERLVNETPLWELNVIG